MPRTAEALMRSRYSAFALRNAEYLTATWHISTCPARIAFQPGQEWLLLRVIRVTEESDTATVEFIARSRVGGASNVLHETSRFVRESGRWLYVEGLIEE